MKSFIEKMKEIWAIPELKNRILLTLGLLAVYRFGSFVILPGIDTAEIQKQLSSGGDDAPGLLDLALLKLIGLILGHIEASRQAFGTGMICSPVDPAAMTGLRPAV